MAIVFLAIAAASSAEQPITPPATAQAANTTAQPATPAQGTNAQGTTFNLSSFPQQRESTNLSFPRLRESISLPFGYLRDSANGGESAANGKTLSQLVVDVANGDNVNDAFNNFYHNAQLRLFSTLDNALAAKATDIIGGYDSVKSAQVKLQSALGNRKAQLGIDIIGAIREKDINADNNNKYAIGWQLHIYAAEGKSKGASGGLFYRRIQNNVLYGINLFADYENHKYGDFYRYGIGGELQNKHVKFAANYYAPITDEKILEITRTETLAGFSREGYDANLQIAIPGASYLQAEAAYYHFDGKGETEADKGFRYGAALSPAGGIKLKLFYDDGGEEFGGELSYLYKFHHRAQKDPQHHDTPMFTADLFAPVLREHSQRIITAAVGPAVSIRITPDMIITTFMTVAAITTTMTTPEMIVRTTTKTEMVTSPRLASVQATVVYRQVASQFFVSTYNHYLVTLPPATDQRPYVITVTRNLHINDPDYRILGGFLEGQFPDVVRTYMLTVVQGSEMFVMVMTITLTNTITRTIPAETTTMTMLAITNTIRTTTFATMFITLTAAANTTPANTPSAANAASANTATESANTASANAIIKAANSAIESANTAINIDSDNNATKPFIPPANNPKDSNSKYSNNPPSYIVIPAQAGIHLETNPRKARHN